MIIIVIEQLVYLCPRKNYHGKDQKYYPGIY